MSTIEKAISPEAVTGFKRIARHENFVILPDKNMIQQVRIITLDTDDQPLAAKIEADTSLKPAQKKAALDRYQDQMVTKSTVNSFVDPETGAFVPQGTAGAIPELEQFQRITFGRLRQMGIDTSDNASFADALYALLGNQIDVINERGEF